MREICDAEERGARDFFLGSSNELLTCAHLAGLSERASISSYQARTAASFLFEIKVYAVWAICKGQDNEGHIF